MRRNVFVASDDLGCLIGEVCNHLLCDWHGDEIVKSVGVLVLGSVERHGRWLLS